MSPKATPYGTWHSPITSDTIVQNVSKYLGPSTLSSISHDYQLPLRRSGSHQSSSTPSHPPSTTLKLVPVKAGDANTSEGKDLFGPRWNARYCVEEYGGGAAIAYGGVVYFSGFGNLKVYTGSLQWPSGGKRRTDEITSSDPRNENESMRHETCKASKTAGLGESTSAVPNQSHPYNSMQHPAQARPWTEHGLESFAMGKGGNRSPR